MPRKSQASHPDHVRTAASKPAQASLRDDAPQAHLFPSHTPLRPSTGITGADVSELLARDDGWLRVVPDEDGKTVWWKWKITRGKWAGFYVMCVGRQDQHAEAIAVMLHKLAKLDRGEDRPTKDSYYDQS